MLQRGGHEGSKIIIISQIDYFGYSSSAQNEV